MEALGLCCPSFIIKAAVPAAGDRPEYVMPAESWGLKKSILFSSPSIICIEQLEDFSNAIAEALVTC